MANITIPLIQDIILDLTESQTQVIYANQYDDNTRVINCHVQNEGEDFDCSNYTICLWIKKSNGLGVTKVIGMNNFGSIIGNIVSFPIIKDFTYSYGRHDCNLELLINDKVIYTCPFYMRVNKSSLQQEEMLDSDDYETINDLYLKTQEQIGYISSEIYTDSENQPINQKDGDYWTKLIN